MALLSALTLENFRSFRRRAAFDLAPLTIITGPNSSGKSSLLKALLLLRHNARLDRLSAPTFSGGGHHLGSLDNVRSHGSKRQTVSLGVGFDWGEEESGEFEWYGDDGQKRFSYFDIGHIHFDLNYGDRADVLADVGGGDYGWPRGDIALAGFRIGTRSGTGRDGEHLLFDLSVGVEWVEVVEVEDEDGNKESAFVPHPVYYYEVNLRGDWFFEDWEEAYDQLGFPDSHPELAEQAARLLSRPLRFRLEKPDSEKSESEVPIPHGRTLSLAKLVEAACNVAHWTNVESGGEPVDDLAANLFFARAVEVFVRPYLLRWTGYLTDKLMEIGHVGAYRASSQRLYPDDGSDAFTQLLRVHMHTPLDENEREDHQRGRTKVERMLQEFGIGDGLHVERVGDAAYTVQIERGEERFHLADLGYGYTQLLPLILNTAYAFDTAARPFPTLLVEEPEANLHPNLQAKLADLFASLSRPEGSHTIVETHSEYLIRRLQYLVAKGQADRKRIAIYYLGADPKSEDYVRRIEIDKYGQLSREFGPGFFDEATNLMVNLYKYGSDN